MSECNENNNCNRFNRFQKNHYFYGKLLGTRDFKSEQEYLTGKRHLLNRLIPGPGLVRGIDAVGLTLREKNGNIEIEFKIGGAAIDGCGNEIIVPADTTMTVSKEGEDDNLNLSKDEIGTHKYLYLKYKEQFTEYVPAVTSPSCCEEKCCPNRVLETFEVIASTKEPGVPGDNVTPCPDLTNSLETGTLKDEIKQWVDKKLSGENIGPGDQKVFLALVKADLSIDMEKTVEYRSYVYNNMLLWELLYCLITASSPSQNGDGYYLAEKIDFTKKNQVKTIDHNFLRFPCVDVYLEISEKSEQIVIDTRDLTEIEEVFFFLKESQAAEIAEMVGQKVEDLDDWAMPLKEFKKKYDKEIGAEYRDREIMVLNPDKFKDYFAELKTKNKDYFKVNATRRLQNLHDTTYGQLKKTAYCVFLKKVGVIQEKVVWKKNPEILEVIVDKKSARVKYKKDKKSTILVVLTA
jgi:hypothetical protein